MRKILISLVLLIIVAAALPALAADPQLQECCKLKKIITLNETPYSGVVGATADCKVGDTAAKPHPDWGILCVINTMNSIVDWIFTILVILSVLFTILGAWTIITAGGTAENVTKGKDFILYAAIGLAVGFLARALPGIVKTIAGF